MRQALAELPDPPRRGAARTASELRDLVVRLRKPLAPEVKKLSVSGISRRQPAARAVAEPPVGEPASQLRRRGARQAQRTGRRLKRRGQARRAVAVRRGRTRRGDTRRPSNASARVPRRLRRLRPRPVLRSQRRAGKGRPLTAGFHLMHGLLPRRRPAVRTDPRRRRAAELDALWHELDFITLAPLRQYKDFIFFERAEPPRFMFEAEFDFARSEDKDCTSEAKMDRARRGVSGQGPQEGRERRRASRRSRPTSPTSRPTIRRVEQARVGRRAEPPRRRS